MVTSVEEPRMKTFTEVEIINVISKLKEAIKAAEVSNCDCYSVEKNLEDIIIFLGER